MRFQRTRGSRLSCKWLRQRQWQANVVQWRWRASDLTCDGGQAPRFTTSRTCYGRLPFKAERNSTLFATGTDRVDKLWLNWMVLRSSAKFLGRTTVSRDRSCCQDCFDEIAFNCFTARFT